MKTFCSIVLLTFFFGCGPHGTNAQPETALDPPADPGATDGTGTQESTLVVKCYWGRTNRGLLPWSRIVHELRATDLGTEVDVGIVFNREFVDNTYGRNAIGWSAHRGHTFQDLHRSDHVELGLINGDGV